MNAGTYRRSEEEKQKQKYIGTLIRHARNEREMTKKDFAPLVGIHRTHLVRVEKGEAEIGLFTIMKISQALDISIADLLDSKPRTKKPSWLRRAKAEMAASKNRKESVAGLEDPSTR